MRTLCLLIFVLCLIWFTWALYYWIRPRTVRDQLIARLQKHPDWKRIKKTEQLLTALYKGTNANRISKYERKKRGLLEDSYIYGEVEFLAFFSLLEKVGPKPGEVFYDLGCGSGRAVFTAALYYDLSKAYGIELLSGLFSMASAKLKKIKHLLTTHDRYFVPTYLKRIATIGFINSNFLNYDSSDGDIVFINATCFSYLLWEQCVTKLTYLKPGSRIIVTSKKLAHPQFDLIQQSFELMSWGLSSVNIYIKIK